MGERSGGAAAWSSHVSIHQFFYKAQNFDFRFTKSLYILSTASPVRLDPFWSTQTQQLSTRPLNPCSKAGPRLADRWTSEGYETPFCTKRHVDADHSFHSCLFDTTRTKNLASWHSSQFCWRHKTQKIACFRIIAPFKVEILARTLT